jgi:hypothetical protein
MGRDPLTRPSLWFGAAGCPLCRSVWAREPLPAADRARGPASWPLGHPGVFVVRYVRASYEEAGPSVGLACVSCIIVALAATTLVDRLLCRLQHRTFTGRRPGLLAARLIERMESRKSKAVAAHRSRITSNDASDAIPPTCMSVARVCRSRCAPRRGRPARWHARTMIALIVALASGRYGTRAVTNTDVQAQEGRAWVR